MYPVLQLRTFSLQRYDIQIHLYLKLVICMRHFWEHCLKFLVCCPFVWNMQLTIMKYVCPVDIRHSLVLTEYGFLHWVIPSACLTHGSRHVGRNSGCTDVTGGLPETNLSPQSRSESWCSHQAIFRQYTVAPLDEKEAFERSDYQVGAKVDRDLISSSSPLSFTRGGVLDQLMGPPWSPSTGSAFSALPSQWTNSSRGIVTAQILLLLLPRLTQHFPWNLTENNL